MAATAGALATGAVDDAWSTVLYVGVPSGDALAFSRGADDMSWHRVEGADLDGAGSYALLAVGDLDGDGDRDALVGTGTGEVLAYANVGTDAAPVWSRRAPWDPGTFGARSAPALGDLDRDGDLDLLVGDGTGAVTGVENAGARTAPIWRANVAWNLPSAGEESHPALGDFDGDGRTDAIVGSERGDLFAYLGTGSRTVPLARAEAWDPPHAGTRVTPAIGDVDGDGRADLVIGDGSARLAVIRNLPTGWLRDRDLDPPDPGSGPAGPAIVAGVVATGGGTSSGGGEPPVALLTVSTSQGPAPLAVRFDATGSTDPEGDGLTFRWNFGDGTQSGGGRDGGGDPTDPPTDDAATAVLKTMDGKHREARIARDADRLDEAIALYLDTVDELLPLTSNTALGGVRKKGTNRIDRVARWYLQKIAHDLGGIYLWNDLGLNACERYAQSLQYSRESAAQAIAGGFPSLPKLNGTNGNITRATKRLRALGCAIPPPAPVFGATAGLDAPGGPLAEHTYDKPGTYVARLDVSDGANTATTSVTIQVTAADGPPPPPPPGGGPSDDPYEGFGASTAGGTGEREIHVTEATDAAVRAAFDAANDGGRAIIVFDTRIPIEILSPLPRLEAPFITLEGNGATLYGPRIGSTQAMLDVRTHDVIVRHLRLRNAGDNLRVQGDEAHDVVISHVSSTGALDDGISIGYGAHDVTIQWCLLAGNTRSIFMKYGATTNVSVHHTWIMKQWVRGPLVSQTVFADVRNVIVDDWTLWGMRFEQSASGNVVSSLFRLGDHAKAMGGKTTSALNLQQDGPAFTAGNVYQGVAELGDEGTSTAPLPAAPVTTYAVGEMTPMVESRAGCLPRDATDQAYVTTDEGWDVTESTAFRLGPGA